MDIVEVYDDTGAWAVFIAVLKREMATRPEMTDLGMLSCYLGVEVEQGSDFTTSIRTTLEEQFKLLVGQQVMEDPWQEHRTVKRLTAFNEALVTRLGQKFKDDVLPA